MKTFIYGVLLFLLFAAIALGTLLSLGPSERAAAPDAPGYHVASVPVPHRDTDLSVHLWYPTEAVSAPELIGQNLLFYGFHARPDAPMIAGARPVIVLVHGSGGNAYRLGWLATELARKGYLVLAANHPGTMSQDSRPEDTVRIWERPQDVAAVLDWLAESPPQGIVPDMGDVSVLGFSIGGHTALALAGVEVTKAAFIEYCASFDDAVDCQWMERGGLDLTTIDETRYNASHADPRPERFIAVDPALPRATRAESLTQIDRPVLLVNLGDPGTLSSAVRVDDWEGMSAAFTYHAVPQSWHFSFLAECSTAGRVVIGLLSRKSEEICTDPFDRTRGDVHVELTETILGFLQASR